MLELPFKWGSPRIIGGSVKGRMGSTFGQEHLQSLLHLVAEPVEHLQYVLLKCRVCVDCEGGRNMC